jgi:hypothetical protein
MKPLLFVLHTSSTHSHANSSLCEEEMRVERERSSRVGGEEERLSAAAFLRKRGVKI